MKKKFATLFFLCFHVINAQNYKAILNFNVETGLPSDIVYSTISDNEGYTWIATDNGVAKFNGTSFKKFTLKDGLPSNDIFNITIDSKKRKWLTGYYKGLYYIKNDKVKFISESKNTNGLSYCFEKKDTIYFRSLSNKQSYYLTKSEKLFKTSKIDSKSIILLNFNKNTNHFVGFDYAKSTYYILNSNKKIIATVPKEYVYYPNLMKEKDFFVFSENFKEINNLNRIVSNKSVAFENNHWTNTLINTVPNEEMGKIQLINKSEDNKYFIYITEHRNCYVYRNGLYNEKLSKKINDLPYNLKSLFTLYIDPNENFWLINKNNKLTYIPKNYNKIETYDSFSLFKKEDNFIKKGFLNDRKIFLVTSDSTLYCYSINDKKTLKIKKYKNVIPQKIFKSNNSLIIDCNTIFDYYKISKESLSSLKQVKSISHRNSAIYKETIYIIGGSNIFIPDKKIEKNLNTQLRCNLICVLNQHTVLAGNEEKIYRFNVLTNKIINTPKIKDATAIGSIGNKILVGTSSRGLYLLSSNLTTIQKTILGENIYEITTDSISKMIYVATNKGLRVFKYNNNLLQLKKTILVNHGLINGKINGILYDTKNILVISSNGFSIIDKQNVLKKINGFIEIENIYTKDSILNPNEIINLKRTQNELKVITSIKTNEEKENFKKYYSLNQGKHTKDNWVEFKESTLAISQLEPGNYKLKLCAIPSDTNKITYSKTIIFCIAPYFWETSWFTIIEYLLGFLMCFILFSVYKKETDKKYILKLKTYNLELKALKAQMNPHFIFNILNNIQSTLFIEGEEKANRFFIKFSNLLRTTLDIVNQESISLDEEIKYLKSYIELEQFRIKENINVSYDIDINIKLKEITIPIMLLQPIVENAILQGLIPSKKEKKLKITLKKDSKTNTIEISIEDNGVGIDFHNTNFRDNNHTSYATSIIKERLEIINKIEKVNYEITTYNLIEESNNTGTRVIFKIKI